MEVTATGKAFKKTNNKSLCKPESFGKTEVIRFCALTKVLLKSEFIRNVATIIKEQNKNAKFLYPFDPSIERIVGAAAAKQIPIKVPASRHLAILI